MKTRNPYANTKKRRAALAFLKSRNITQPRPIYPIRTEFEREPNDY